MNEAKYEIGTLYKTRGKHPRECEVVDILKTYNSKGELAYIRYVSVHDFLGQKITNYDVVETTITMGLLKDHEIDEDFSKNCNYYETAK